MKLEPFALSDAAITKLLDQLEKEGFLNEARYADHFAVSKLRQNGWGKLKIRAALREKGIGEENVAAALEAIDHGEYAQVVRAQVKKQWAKEKGRDRFERQQRVLRHLIARGFEADRVRAALLA